MGRVYLEGSVAFPPHEANAIRDALKLHIELTRAESGCIFFYAIEDPDKPGFYFIRECFTDEAALELHKARSAISDWGTISKNGERNYHIMVENTG